MKNELGRGRDTEKKGLCTCKGRTEWEVDSGSAQNFSNGESYQLQNELSLAGGDTPLVTQVGELSGEKYGSN